VKYIIIETLISAARPQPTDIPKYLRTSWVQSVKKRVGHRKLTGIREAG